MKVFFRILFVIGLILGSCFALPIYAQNIGVEKIDNFKTTIQVNPDSSIRVKEEITYDFGFAEKHGIFRDIPIKYTTIHGLNQSLLLKDIIVTDENNTPYQFSVSQNGGLEDIKIGNPDRTITGVHTYIISYTVNRSIGYFDTFDEIYWNATGNKWQVPILQSSASVILPIGVPKENLKRSCYYGPLGINRDCYTMSSFFTEGDLIKGVFFNMPFELSAGEGLTIALGFPKGIVQEPDTLHKILNFIVDNKIILLPLVVFIVMFCIWWKKGRDPKGSGVVVPEYDVPEGLTPLEIAGVLDTRIKNDKLSAEIIYLATQGYLKITKIGKEKGFLSIFEGTDYQIDLLKEYSDIKNNFDKKMLESIFLVDFLARTYDNNVINLFPPEQKSLKTIRLSQLKNSFFKNIPEITKLVFDSLTDRGYYKENPEKVLKPYLYIPSIIFVFIYLAFHFFGSVYLAGGFSLIEIIFVVVISAFIVFAFGKLMPVETKEGVSIKDKIIGLKEYLQIAEKDRIDFHNAPERNPQIFEKLLPYAMVLGVEKEWAKEFEGIYINQPTWYHDTYNGGVFNAVLFTNSLSNFNSVANSNLSSSPRGSGSGGGGFSGGGGGGGGGGSW